MNEWMVDVEFPGGNGIIERVQPDAIYLRPDLRDTEGEWFWWCFRVRGAEGPVVRVVFTGQDVIGGMGPAVSTDRGRSWQWLGRDAVRERSFRFPAPPDDAEVRFAFAPPYTLANLEAFIARLADARLHRETLCRSRAGRPLPVLRLGRTDGRPDARVLLTCRHHCCECMASWGLEGVIEFLLSDAPEAAAFRERCELLAIPMVDLDGVEQGDQGKNRRPRDHNRDYDAQPVHPETAAIREMVPRWSRGRLRVSLDLHCPHIRGAYNEQIYFVGSPDDAVWERTGELCRILERTRTGPLPYAVTNNLPFGQAWNTGQNFGGGISSARWVGGLPGVAVAGSIELPYALAQTAVVTPRSARAFGRDLGRAIALYLSRQT